ncbi:transcription elongation factor [Xylariaceae sp. FL0255]|nr:transcription elongation factor [Xylariaceae sp. FL0255]
MVDKAAFDAKIKAIQKAANSKEPSSRMIELLDGLKEEGPITEELLRTTRAGILVGKLRAHADKDVGRAANTLVQKWRQAVEAEKRAKGLSVAKQAARDSASPGKPASPAPSKAPVIKGAKKPYEGNPDTRHFKTDKVDLNRTDSTIRNNCIGVIYNGLAFRSTEPVEAVLFKAIEVEVAGFKAYKGEGQEYREKIRSLFANLKNPKNPDLSRNVMSGVISPERFVKMTSKELLSDEQRKRDAELEEENMKKAQVPMAEKSYSDTIQCSGCKQFKVSYTQAQTRSADEPMTTFCECMNCGKRWKFS